MLNFEDFKVGDRVVLVSDDRYEAGRNPDLYIGVTGTVVELYNAGHKKLIGVEWDHCVTAGHACNGNGKVGYCWRVEFQTLNRIDSKPIDDTQLMEVLLC